MHRTTDNYPIAVYNSMDEMSSLSHPRRQRQRQQNKSDDGNFLEILHRLLDESEDSEHHIVSWTVDGLCFQIHDSQRFEQFLMPVYFGGRIACSTGHHQHEPLEGYDSFLGRLEYYGFYRISNNNAILNDTCSHPLFVRGKKYLALRMICHEPTSLFQHRDSWPMPALSNSTKHPTDFHKANSLRRSEKTCRPRPCRTSISNLKNNASFQRMIPSYQHPIDKRLSFKETLLQRKLSACGNQFRSQPLSRNKATLLELLSDISFGNDDENDNDDEYEPLCVSTSCNVSLDVIDLSTDIDDITPTRCGECHVSHHPIIDGEPLDPVRHKDDDSLVRDIAEALAGI